MSIENAVPVPVTLTHREVSSLLRLTWSESRDYLKDNNVRIIPITPRTWRVDTATVRELVGDDVFLKWFTRRTREVAVR